MRSAAPTRLSSAQSTQIRAVGILLEMRLMCAVRGDTAVSRQALGKLRLGGQDLNPWPPLQAWATLVADHQLTSGVMQPITERGQTPAPTRARSRRLERPGLPRRPLAEPRRSGCSVRLLLAWASTGVDFDGP